MGPSSPAATSLHVVSADAALRRRARAVLSGQGLLSTGASSIAGLARKVAGQVGAALIDPRLPGLGESPLPRLRAEPGLRRCALVLLTGAERAALAGNLGGPALIGLMLRVHSQVAGDRQLALLHDVSGRLATGLDLRATMDAVLEAVASRLRFDTATLFLPDNTGQLCVRAARGYDADLAALRGFAPGEGVVGWAVENRVPTIVGDSSLDSRFAAGDGRSARSLLAVPLCLGDRVLAVLSLVRRAPAEPFDDADLVLVGTISTSAAAALENARLYEQERALAARLEEVNQLYGQEHEILEKLQAYDRLYTSVVSTVSHELKTPLMSIRGFAQMIRDGDVDEAEAADFAGEIHDNALRLSRYVDTILTEDAVHNERLVLEFVEVSLSDVVAEVLRALAPTLREGHRLVDDVPRTLPPVKGDHDKLCQVVSNLVGNAIKYSPEGGMVRVSAHVTAEMVELVVEDQGVGIPEEARPRIFDRFFRVDSAATRKVTGTGLGLSIVRGLVNLHSGRVWVESGRGGRGSAFHVTLPRAARLAVAPPTIEDPEPVAAARARRPAVEPQSRRRRSVA